MDPAPQGTSRRSSSSGKGGKGRGGSRLGMKTSSLRPPAPSPPQSSSPVQREVAAPAPPGPTATSFSPSPPGPTPAAFPARPPGPTAAPFPARPPSPVPAAFPARPPGPAPNFFPAQMSSPGVPISAPNSWVYPPGGFVNFLQQPQGENFHLVGGYGTSAMSPPAPGGYGTAASQFLNEATCQGIGQGTSSKHTVIVDNDNKEDNSEANKVVKKRYWTHEEEERPASAWLNASKDPIKGNDKKGDTFWNEVTDEYNKKGNGKRRREINQLKVHWSRLKSSISDFNDYWTKVSQMHTSGYSDDMLEEEAQKLYKNRFGKPFSLVHWWKILKNEPKWCAMFQDTEKDKSEVVDVPDEQLRPIGREAAKAERSGKRKKENVMEGIVILGDNIDKIVKLQQERKVERDKVTEAQIHIADSNLNAKMFEVYNSLLNQDTSQMSVEQKASRDRAIRKIEEKLFAD